MVLNALQEISRGIGVPEGLDEKTSDVKRLLQWRAMATRGPR